MSGSPDVTSADRDPAPASRRVRAGAGPSRRRTAALALAAMLALGGAAAGAVFLATHPNSSTLAGMTWSKASIDQPAGLDHPLQAVIGTGSGFLAGGSGTDEDTDPLLWTSADGRSWQPLSGGPMLGEVDALAAFGGRIYAAGGHGHPIDEQPTVWSSTDGRRWTALTLPDGGGAVHALAAGPTGLVAAASEPAGATSLWHSPDGEQWQLVDLAAQGLLPGGGTIITAMAATASGYIALGGQTSALPAVPLFMLTSPDGVRWSRVAAADLPTAGGASMNVSAESGTATLQPDPAPVTALAADQGGVLALAIDQDLRWRPQGNATINHIAPAVWASADGWSWSRVDQPAPYAPGEWTYQAPWPTRVNAAVRAGDVLWAAGTTAQGVGQSAMDAAVWASTDGAVHWTPLPNTWQGLLSGGQGSRNPRITGLAYARGILVAIGATDDLTPVAWRAAPPGH